MFLYKCDPAAHIPTRNTKEDSGWDFRAVGNERVIVHPGEIVKVPTGIVLACPVNTPGWIWDRSSNGAKGLKVLGGVIDNYYVGEISIILGNMNLWNIIRLLQGKWASESMQFAIANAISDSTITIEPGKAVAQMVFHSVVDLQEIRELPEEQFRKEFASRYDDARGTKGFGGVSQEVLKKLNDSPQTEEQIRNLLSRVDEPATLKESEDRSC